MNKERMSVNKERMSDSESSESDMKISSYWEVASQRINSKNLSTNRFGTLDQMTDYYSGQNQLRTMSIKTQDMEDLRTINEGGSSSNSSRVHHMYSEHDTLKKTSINDIKTKNPIHISSYQENRGKRWSSEEDMYLLQQINFLSCVDIGKHLKRSENAVVSRLKKLAFHMIQNGDDPVLVQNNLKLTNEDMEQINNEFFVYPRKNTGKFITTIKSPQQKKGYFQTNPSPPKQEIQLLLEIRQMLKKLLNQNTNENTGSENSISIKSRLSDQSPRSFKSPGKDRNIESIDGRIVLTKTQPTFSEVASQRRESICSSSSGPICVYDINFDELERHSEQFAKMN
jgi:hypothetical protein